MNTTCIKCQEENAYNNGVCYECPDCDYEWNENQFDFIDEEDDNEAEKEEYKKLLKLAKPFFKLNHGKIHECTVGYIYEDDYLEEQIKLVPLAFQKNSNCFFIITDIDKMQKEFPNAIKDLSKMSYTDLWNDGIDNYFDGSYSKPISFVVATNEFDRLVSNNDFFYGFKEIG